MAYEITWQNQTRADITFSLEGAQDTRHAAECAERAIMDAGSGYTRRDGSGGWENVREHSVTLSLIGDYAHAIDAAASALFACGCVALQLETWTPEYGCAEIRES